VFKVAAFGLDASIIQSNPQSLAGEVRPVQTQCTHVVVTR